MDIEEQYDKIYRYCYFKLYDKHTAQDITQEAFLRFYKQKLSLDKSSELPYLYTIAKNLCVDAFRKKTYENADDLEQPKKSADPSEGWTNNLAIRAAVAKLPNEEQEVLFLRYVNDESLSYICRITGLSRFSVYRRLKKALNTMKKELMKEGF